MPELRGSVGGGLAAEGAAAEVARWPKRPVSGYGTDRQQAIGPLAADGRYAPHTPQFREASPHRMPAIQAAAAAYRRLVAALRARTARGVSRSSSIAAENSATRSSAAPSAGRNPSRPAGPALPPPMAVPPPPPPPSSSDRRAVRRAASASPSQRKVQSVR